MRFRFSLWQACCTVRCQLTSNALLWEAHNCETFVGEYCEPMLFIFVYSTTAAREFSKNTATECLYVSYSLNS